MLALQAGSGGSNPSAPTNLILGGHQDGIGEATKTTKRKYKIIERSDGFYVKKRFGPFYLFIRTNFHKIHFTKFQDVVMYVIEKRRSDREH